MFSQWVSSSLLCQEGRTFSFLFSDSRFPIVRICSSFFVLLLFPVVCCVARAETNGPAAALDFGKARLAVEVQPDGLIVCEAEEFQVQSPGWQAKRWGENYYAATLANTFLSRQAFLGAPEQCEKSEATLQVQVPEAGRYLALVRYEVAYRFETQFRVVIEQDGARVFDRQYGARENLKIWPFSQKLKTEIAWDWGAVENVVWEGHDAFVNLKPGPATVTLVADKQPSPGARRNVDLLMLTTDVEQVNMRIETENYLPLDGMLTQSGDVWLRVTNVGSQPLTFGAQGPMPGGGNWQQHSPYWVHLRNWKTPTIEVSPGQTSEWVEVGGTMDTLNHGQWSWTGNGKYQAEFALRNPAGKLETIRTFTGEGDLLLAAEGDTRYSRRLRTQDEVLYDLLDYLKKQPAHGKTPTRTQIHALTFTPSDDPKHAAAVNEFRNMFALDRNDGTVVSLGDEIGLPQPDTAAAGEDFRNWLKNRGLQPSDVDRDAGDDWTKINYNPDPQLQATNPGQYYWSRRYLHAYGIRAIKQRTDSILEQNPRAKVGANYSPHYPNDHMYLGEVFKWVTVFRDDGMTLPWSEDYIWQVAIGTQQMNEINLDLFRAGLRGKADRKIMYYVMPHSPGNTPRMWRRHFYGALSHGMKMVNLFEFQPVYVAYTENHVSDPAMFAMVLRSFRELGLYEDIVQDGEILPAETALWFSETGDIWGDNHGSFAAAKRALYTAIRHQQIPLDFVIERDALDGTLSSYKVLYLTDAHVSRSASEKIAAWVASGGQLLATAGAGMFDELNRPNRVMRELLGVDQILLDAGQGTRIRYIKQDLPFAKPIDTVQIAEELFDPRQVAVTARPDNSPLPVFGVRSRVNLLHGQIRGVFSDGSPAIVERQTGKGKSVCCGFLPSLSYYQPAIPQRPVDRGSTDDAMSHFLPTEFHQGAATLMGLPGAVITRPVVCSEPLVESTVIQSQHGTLIPLVNWTPDSVKSLKVTVDPELAGSMSATLASGGELVVSHERGRQVYSFDLDVADALILR